MELKVEACSAAARIVQYTGRGPLTSVPPGLPRSKSGAASDKWCRLGGVVPFVVDSKPRGSGFDQGEADYVYQ